jgi:hypothetical protein
VPPYQTPVWWFLAHCAQQNLGESLTLLRRLFLAQQLLAGLVTILRTALQVANGLRIVVVTTDGVIGLRFRGMAQWYTGLIGWLGKGIH